MCVGRPLVRTPYCENCPDSDAKRWFLGGSNLRPPPGTALRALKAEVQKDWDLTRENASYSGGCQLSSRPPLFDLIEDAIREAREDQAYWDAFIAARTALRKGAV